LDFTNPHLGKKSIVRIAETFMIHCSSKKRKGFNININISKRSSTGLFFWSEFHLPWLICSLYSIIFNSNDLFWFSLVFQSFQKVWTFWQVVPFRNGHWEEENPEPKLLTLKKHIVIHFHFLTCFEIFFEQDFFFKKFFEQENCWVKLLRDYSSFVMS